MESIFFRFQKLLNNGGGEIFQFLKRRRFFAARGTDAFDVKFDFRFGPRRSQSRRPVAIRQNECDHLAVWIRRKFRFQIRSAAVETNRQIAN